MLKQLNISGLNIENGSIGCDSIENEPNTPEIKEIKGV